MHDGELALDKISASNAKNEYLEPSAVEDIGIDPDDPTGFTRGMTVAVETNDE